VDWINDPESYTGGIGWNFAWDRIYIDTWLVTRAWSYHHPGNAADLNRSAPIKKPKSAHHPKL